MIADSCDCAMDQPKHVGYVDPSYPSPLGPDDADIVIYG